MNLLQKLPFDLFNYLVEVGNISGQDLINLAEIYNYKKNDIFRKQLKKDYNVDLKNEYVLKNSDKDLYKDYVKIFGKKFRKDRAIVLLVRFERNIENLEEIEKELENSYPGYKRYLRRGDIIENIYKSGYRTNGIYMYNGEKIIDLNYELYEYGTPSKEFLVFKEFCPDYWDCIFVNECGDCKRELNVNNIYHPDRNSEFYWCDPIIPVVVDKKILEPLVEKELLKDVKTNKYYNYNYVNVDFKNKRYRVTIPDDFSERDDLYYESYTEGFLQNL
jgi:hypothetical protein